MLKYIVGAGAVIVVLIGAYYFLVVGQPAASPNPAPTGQQTGMATSTYATSSYSIIYPADYTKDEKYAYDQFGPEKLIHGVKFTVPTTMATGTNLTADTYISVEQLPRAKNCTADIYIKQDVRATSITDGGTLYSVATSSDAGAGNLVEETVYALTGSSPCTAIRYVVHSGNIGNYPQAGEPGAVQEFNRSALMNAFDTIRRSLQLTQTAQNATPSMMQP